MLALTGGSADEVWRAAAAALSDGGLAHAQSGRGGATDEVLHVMLQVTDPRRRWVVSRRPAMSPAFALVEALWIAAGRRDARLPAFWNPNLPAFCGPSPELAGAYGYRLRSHFGIDQLDRVFDALYSRPDSRQAVLQIWDPAADLPAAGGVPARDDIPCNIVAFPKVRAGRLEWLQIMRSNDVFRGLPYNLVQFTVLQEMIAGWLGVAVGAYTHVSDSLHVYAADRRHVAASIASPPVLDLSEPHSSFALPRAEWDPVIADVLFRLEEMARPGAAEASVRAAALASDVPGAYEDALRIAGADAARRRGWDDLAAECAANCKCPALLAVWEQWLARFQDATPAGTGSGAVPRPGDGAIDPARQEEP
jgi:thymidylate synthase